MFDAGTKFGAADGVGAAYGVDAAFDENFDTVGVSGVVGIVHISSVLRCVETANEYKRKNPSAGTRQHTRSIDRKIYNLSTLIPEKSCRRVFRVG